MPERGVSPGDDQAYIASGQQFATAEVRAARRCTGISSPKWGAAWRSFRLCRQLVTSLPIRSSEKISSEEHRQPEKPCTRIELAADDLEMSGGQRQRALVDTSRMPASRCSSVPASWPQTDTTLGLKRLTASATVEAEDASSPSE